MSIAQRLDAFVAIGGQVFRAILQAFSATLSASLLIADPRSRARRLSIRTFRAQAW
jgi:hypothetical protein